MQRRWLRHNPWLPENPCGRGVALLRELETAGADARARVSAQWRRARSRGFSPNQLRYFRERLAAWNQLSTDEQVRLERQLTDELGIALDALPALRDGALLERWTHRVRETNTTMSALEMRLQELRGRLAHLDDLRHAGAAVDAVREAEAAADGAEAEIAALARRCRDLQETVVQELLVDGVDMFPEFMRRLVDEGIFLAHDVREFRGFADLSHALDDTAR